MCIMIVNFKQLSLSFVTRQCHVHFSLNEADEEKLVAWGNRKISEFSLCSEPENRAKC